MKEQQESSSVECMIMSGYRHENAVLHDDSAENFWNLGGEHAPTSLPLTIKITSFTDKKDILGFFIPSA